MRTKKRYNYIIGKYSVYLPKEVFQKMFKGLVPTVIHGDIEFIGGVSPAKVKNAVIRHFNEVQQIVERVGKVLGQKEVERLLGWITPADLETMIELQIGLKRIMKQKGINEFGKLNVEVRFSNDTQQREFEKIIKRYYGIKSANHLMATLTAGVLLNVKTPDPQAKIDLNELWERLSAFKPADDEIPIGDEISIGIKVNDVNPPIRHPRREFQLVYITPDHPENLRAYINKLGDYRTFIIRNEKVIRQIPASLFRRIFQLEGLTDTTIQDLVAVWLYENLNKDGRGFPKNIPTLMSEVIDLLIKKQLLTPEQIMAHIYQELMSYYDRPIVEQFRRVEWERMLMAIALRLMMMYF